MALRQARGRYGAAFSALALAVAFLASGALAEPAGANHLKAECFPAGTTTVYKTQDGRFYTRTVQTSLGDVYREHYACSYRYGRSFRLQASEFPEEDRYELFRISGHFAAYVGYLSCAACEDRRARVTSLNLRTGDDRWLNGTSLREEYEPTEEAHDLVLKSNGSFASIASGTAYFPNERTVTQVRARDSEGKRTLDKGPAIERRSLTLDGNLASWTNAGATKSATLR